VVDDGSTDGSLEVLRQFLPRIKLETGSNRGGNSARNRAFALSTGDYIQYLDADDYLAPEKIARQVRFLEESGADVVYGDWRYRRHLSDVGYSYLDRIELSRDQPLILASLLSGRWWVAPGAILYKRHMVIEAGGWDESLRAAQDRDFFTSVVLANATIRYQPGCDFIYRKYGEATVSSSNLVRWVENHRMTLKKSETALAQLDRLTGEYKAALAQGYFELARGTCYTISGRPSRSEYTKMLDSLLDKVLDLSPQFNPTNETSAFMVLQRLLSFKFAAHILFPLRAFVHRVKSTLKQTFVLGLLLRMTRTELEYRPLE
jgi:glycosyltransferase involved in cell wall biosynthesis